MVYNSTFKQSNSLLLIIIPTSLLTLLHCHISVVLAIHQLAKSQLLSLIQTIVLFTLATYYSKSF